ncbi:MAG: TonB-dependent receptor, partial [Geminicoccaceae bacterium]|nr:TonB-dependent receptor [Geminicoccaceae bacterium]
YVYWKLGRRWALTGEVLFEDFDRDNISRRDQPDEVDTVMIPLAARYFGPKGFFGVLEVNAVHQNVDRPDNDSELEGDEAFALINAAVGLRLPQRRGILSLEVRNLFDDQFRFQDDDFRAGSEVHRSTLLPERTFVARITLNL